MAPYRLGHWLSFGCCVLAMVMIAVQAVYYRSVNRTEAQIASGERPDDSKDFDGENSLEFRYVC